MSKKHVNALQKAGIDSDRYLSMRIDKSQIPDGAEVVFQIRDRNTGKIIPMPADEAAERYFGKHSKFYKQTMADGFIFNPYIHRRFLPAQFRRNIRYAGFKGIRDYVRTSYGWNYVTRFLTEECGKLAMLEKHDREAFNERRRFFPLFDMRNIFCDYAAEVVRVLNGAEMKPFTYGNGAQKTTYFLPKGIGFIKKEHMRPMKYRFAKFQESVKSFGTYAQLADYLEKFDFAKLGCDIPVCDAFVNRFLESGAFYTLKQMIMFEGLSLGGDDVMENLRILNTYPQNNLLFLFRQYDK